ncbi:hypothetical protein JDN40_00745 [Rhodomicrobium vannielii ATCC 17100]|nr:hypothetical protein [Rhodomicrobium vannielii]MBJ7532661.1 hypothetical protein [Rhodomicrobium vannielii ATCC 17100]
MTTDDENASADELDASTAESGEDSGTAAIWAALHRDCPAIGRGRSAKGR